MHCPAFGARRYAMLLFFLGAPAAFCHVAERPPQVGEPATGPIASLVAAFDAAVAAGLPADIALPGEAVESGSTSGTARQRRSVSHLIVQDALNIDVEIAGLPMGRMYRGLYDGQEAAMTRIGDHLDISVPVREGVEVTGFRSDRTEVLHEHVRNPVLPVPERKPAPRPRDESHVMPESPFLSRNVRAIEDRWRSRRISSS